MNNYTFTHEYTGAIILIPGISYEKVYEELNELLSNASEWICQDEEGEKL